jgi:serine/threonine protein kinase
VCWLGAKIATALQDIHRQHVIHLDVKPANIMLRDNGPAVMIDYGLARHDELPDLLAEESDLPIGTSAYMAPEQVLGIRTDPRSDIFALGVVLYEMASGEKPFGNPTTRAGMRQRLYHEPRPLRALQPHIAPWLQEIILRCLEVEADHRYPTAAQLAFDLAHPDAVRTHLARLHGTSTDGWQHVATYAIPYALPAMVPPLNVRPEIDLGDGIFLAGDHRATASIQGALASGRRAARAAITQLGRSLIHGASRWQLQLLECAKKHQVHLKVVPRV